MDSTPLLSIIIPVYNAELYLRQCIDSIVEQTYVNLQIILVDDGSTDESGHIVDEYAEKDSRMTVIHQSNHGEGHARNTGLYNAKGEYIAFVDCDDYIEPSMYEKLISVAVEDDADIVACSWYKNYSDKMIPICNEGEIKQGTFEQDDFLYYLYHRDKYRGFSYMWDKVYKRELIYDSEDSFIHFREDITLGGDVIYLGEVALRSHRIRYIDDPLYYYRIREESGCHAPDLTKRLDWIRSYDIL